MADIEIRFAGPNDRPDSIPTLSVSGWQPVAPVTLEQSFSDDSGTLWRSRALMYASVFGTVSTAETASQGGTYQDIDPLGLWWSMLPADIEQSTPLEEKYRRHPNTQPHLEDMYLPFDVSVTASSAGQVVASSTYTRHQIAPSMSITEVDDAGIRGFFYAPRAPKTKGAVIVMGGSSGGLDRYWARHLASHGFSVLNLAYFNYPGLPDTLTRLPLEYFKKAIDWLKHRTGTQRVGLQGASRGGEAVLLIASTFPDDIACVVSYVPMHVKTGGFIPGSQEQVAAWTLNGQDLGFARTPVPTLEECRARGIDSSRGLPVVPFYYDCIAEGEKSDDAWVPVERAKAPILMITAQDDAIWACSHGAEKVLERLSKRGGTAHAEHLCLPGAGHIMPPTGTITSLSTSMYHQHGELLIALGGTPAVNAHAGDKAWKRAIEFLSEHLR